MKLFFLSLAALLCFGLLTKVKGSDTTNDIVSGNDMTNAVRQLGDPTTQMVALKRLIKFSGIFLYNDGGSIYLATGDPAADELRRTAARAIRSQANLDTVRRALSDGDSGVRFWGVMSFGFIFGQREPWKPLLPRLEEIAAHDEVSNIRREAIRKLWYYDEAATFLTGLQESTAETDPDVLMTLLRFDSQKPEIRAQWHAHAVKFLSGKDEALRLQWLEFIWGNVWNPSTAPMWRIDADPALVESLKQIQRTGSKKETDLATKILNSIGIKNDH
jgi:hypothetical protein